MKKEEQIENYKQQLESVFQNRTATNQERTEEISEFDKTLGRLILKEDYTEGTGMDEVIARLKTDARKEETLYLPEVQTALKDLSKYYKYASIICSGQKAEDTIANYLNYICNKKYRVFRNVLLVDDETGQETEIDDIVVTDIGTVLLEVKRISCDITINEDGYMLMEDGTTNDSVPLMQKMAARKRLLEKKLSQMMNETGSHFPLYVDTLLVFDTPKYKHLYIQNDYEGQKWVFANKLRSWFENCYFGHIKIDENQFETACSFVSELSKVKKTFDLPFDPDELSQHIAEALVTVYDSKEEIIPAPQLDAADPEDSLALPAEQANVMQEKPADTKSFTSSAARAVAAGILISVAAAECIAMQYLLRMASAVKYSSLKKGAC